MIEEKALTDAQLVESAKLNPESFGFLMERYQGSLFHYIRRLTQLQNDDVQDLLQEVFIKIYQNLNAYDSDLKFSSWAYRIAHNQVIDHFRRVSSRPKTNALEDYEWDKLIQASVHLEKELANKDCVEKIKSCIQDLPMKYKEILILRFVEEKEYEEIMDILRKPKGTVATLIARGKQELKKKMKEQSIDCF
ncbi:MAG: RNA polymerase sigma factor [Candidatus Moranbacteria bacterium]|nr:RNA polymerase sigma factor [Candidatus Moranbacteria bacterium]